MFIIINFFFINETINVKIRKKTNMYIRIQFVEPISIDYCFKHKDGEHLTYNTFRVIFKHWFIVDIVYFKIRPKYTQR